LASLAVRFGFGGCFYPIKCLQKRTASPRAEHGQVLAGSACFIVSRLIRCSVLAVYEAFYPQIIQNILVGVSAVDNLTSDNAGYVWLGLG
jgi:hypothetical protein